MCVLVVSKQQSPDWPLMVAMNREEDIYRPFRSPGAHWPKTPHICGGYDEIAGGTWFAASQRLGLVAVVVNHEGEMGSADGKHSRGELPLMALEHESAQGAIESLKFLKPEDYRGFYLFVGDKDRAFVLSNVAANVASGVSEKMEVSPVLNGLSFVTGRGLNTTTCPRTRLYYPQFKAASLPAPDQGDLQGWDSLLSSHQKDMSGAWRSSMILQANEDPDGPNSVTVCQSFAGISAAGRISILHKNVFQGEEKTLQPILTAA